MHTRPQTVGYGLADSPAVRRAAGPSAYRQLIYFNEVDRGGHFAAWEQPELFTTEVRAAFRPLR
jgi:pimeloyl-ACP methyl ester carboxylesterase